MIFSEYEGEDIEKTRAYPSSKIIFIVPSISVRKIDIPSIESLFSVSGDG